MTTRRCFLPILLLAFAAPAMYAQGTLADYQKTFSPLLLGVFIAIILAFILKETGSAVRRMESAADLRG